MSIRKTLIIFVSILALLISGFAISGLYKSWNDKKNYEYARKTSGSIDLLLSAAGNWAVERGVTNSGLSSAGKASDKMLATISKRRADGDKAYKEAMEEVQQYEFKGNEEFIRNVEKAYLEAIAIRLIADKNLKIPQIKRDTQTLKSFVPTMSKLIVSSQDLRFALTKKTAKADSELGRQSQLKHFSWIMSEFAGRERAVIGGTISADLGIDETKLATLSRFRGNVETGWNIVKKLSSESNQEVLETIEKTKELFFGPYQNLRLSIYDAAINGDDFPINTQKWIEESTNAINTILATQEALTKETDAYLIKLLSDANSNLIFNTFILLISLTIVAMTFYVVIIRVSAPIDSMTKTMRNLADGDINVEVPAINRKDEIGGMAKSVQIFKENAIQRIKLEEDQKLAEQRSIEEKKMAMNNLADSFEQRVQSIVQTISAAAFQLERNADSMTGFISQSSKLTEQSVKDSSSTSDNVQSVASAGEEMSATVKDISEQIHRSNGFVSDSVKIIEDADKHAQELSNASQRVREVTELISDISNQINLLSLNATIEAARAGEAGKGFSVVAGEVKNLAKQTDNSIQEIEKVIDDMSSVSGDIVDSLNAIKESVNNIFQTSGSVAVSVEEQSSTTNEIVSNMHLAASATKNISNNLNEISKGTNESHSSSSQVLEAAQDLSKQSEILSVELNEFLSEIRSG